MEKNKVTTYLLYAIGEIVLVVIGILIAVSINNLKKQEENKQLAYLYTQSLISDLKKDTAIYRDKIKNNLVLIKHLDSANLFISNPSTSPSDLLAFAQEKYDIAILGYWGNESTTLKTLITTGNYELYPLVIREQIAELNRINEEISRYSSDGIKWALNSLRDHENRYLRGKINNLMMPNDQLTKAAWAGLNEREFISSFINLMNTKYVIVQGWQAGLEKQLIATTELIKSLEKLE